MPTQEEWLKSIMEAESIEDGPPSSSILLPAGQYDLNLKVTKGKVSPGGFDEVLFVFNPKNVTKDLEGASLFFNCYLNEKNLARSVKIFQSFGVNKDTKFWEMSNQQIADEVYAAYESNVRNITGTVEIDKNDSTRNSLRWFNVELGTPETPNTNNNSDPFAV